MKVKTVRELGCKPCPEFPNGIKPEGTLIDHPDAWKLVRLGNAVPADEEAAARANMTPEQFAQAKVLMDDLISGATVPDEAYEDDEEGQDDEE